jgi:hypothetical protein
MNGRDLVESVNCFRTELKRIANCLMRGSLGAKGFYESVCLLVRWMKEDCEVCSVDFKGCQLGSTRGSEVIEDDMYGKSVF